MPRVRIRNTSTSNIGFSFGFLFRGQQALIDASKLSEGDKRMITAKKLVVEPEEVKMSEPVKEEVKPNVPENKAAPERVEPVAPTPPVAPVVAPTPAEVPAQPGPVAAVPAPAVEPAAPAKPKYTETQLSEMTKAQLKELSKGLGADGRSRASMIKKILESQEK